jgi:hypothetical protein
MIVRPETPSDYEAIDELLQLEQLQGQGSLTPE